MFSSQFSRFKYGASEQSKDDKRPRYIDKLLESKKKRDLEKMIRDERKQEKERKTEGDKFKDKDVFVTSAYRKQLEETVKFRKELEESDKIDEMTSVRGQRLWRENFGKKLLDARFGEEQPEEDVNPEIPDAKRIKLGYREAERKEQDKRMRAVRRILRQRNTADDIKLARERYFERRNAGLISP